MHLVLRDDKLVVRTFSEYVCVNELAMNLCQCANNGITYVQYNNKNNKDNDNDRNNNTFATMTRVEAIHYES